MELYRYIQPLELYCSTQPLFNLKNEKGQYEDYPLLSLFFLFRIFFVRSIFTGIAVRIGTPGEFIRHQHDSAIAEIAAII